MENKKSAVTVRKAEDGDDDDDPEEERKIEKFYSLLRSFRDARDRRRKELDDLDRNDNSEKKKKMKRTKEETSCWVPSFEWEDFTTEIEFRRPPLVSPTPCNPKGGDSKKEKNQDDGLDLKLAL